MALIHTLLISIALFAAFTGTAFADVYDNPTVIAYPTEELPICPRGRVYKECGNCENTCWEYDECQFPCEPGCYCSTGMIDVDGVCVDKATYCGGPLCPRGKLYFAGCICLPGEIEIDGACVNIEGYCKERQCHGNRVFKECGRECDNYCPGHIRCKPCEPGCYCDDGFLLSDITNQCYLQTEMCP